MNFESHQDIPLKQHLKEVANKSREIILSKNIELIDKNILADISYLIGVSHDFGKYTTFFQKSRIKKIPIDNENLGNHSLISALFSFELLQEYNKNLKGNKLFLFIPQIAYFIIKHHHGNLDNIENDIDSEKLFYSGFKLISKQLEDIAQYSNQIISEYDSLLSDFEISGSNIFSRMDKYKKSITYAEDIKPIIKTSLKIPIRKMIKENNVVFYLISQLLYSVLIDSDKKNAGKVRSITRKELPENLVERYLNQQKFKEKNKSEINPIRNQIRKYVLENINTDDKIFTLTAPTGTGKTLASFAGALKLRKILKEKLELINEPRIIYSLPFTSIIDQNFNVFDEVLQQLEDFKEHRSEYLLKHHYLADVFYKTPKKDKKKEIEVDESLALIESWESEFVVTTFIQLFHTLIGYKNRMLKKFHNIVNSIIILDEVQNIPLKYWSLVHDVLIALTKYFNCRVILMTATKPLIFNEEKDDFKELVSDYKQFFQSDELNRVKLNYLKSQTIDEFYNNLPDFKLDSYLFVFNTIGSSLDFFRKIKNLSGYKKFYLSTNIIPKERKDRIEDIKKLIDGNRKTDEKQKFIVVSTQMIEAGVDIDCECAYRDLGPLDSIIQVAGRCNRNNLSNENGIVNIMRLQKNDKYDYCKIYDPILNDISEKNLKNRNSIKESDFLDLIEEYFIEAIRRMYSDTNLIKSIEKLNYNDTKDNNPISSFKLIENDDYYKKDVFIEFDKKAKEVWQKFVNLKQIKDTFKRKTAFLKFRKDFYDYVISVPDKYVPEKEYENTRIIHIPNDTVNSCYDEQTGWKRTSDNYKSYIF